SSHNLRPRVITAIPPRDQPITGRNHHSAASGVIGEAATGYDGYTCVLPRNCGTVGESRFHNDAHGTCIPVIVWTLERLGSLTFFLLRLGELAHLFQRGFAPEFRLA